MTERTRTRNTLKHNVAKKARSKKKKEKEKKKKKELGPTVLTGRASADYSRVRSLYRATRRLLPALFPAWAGLSLSSNLDARAFAQSPMLTPYLEWTPDRHSTTNTSDPDLKQSASSSPEVARLQTHATTSSCQAGYFKDNLKWAEGSLELIAIPTQDHTPST